jgi:hypothetical protein
MSLHDIVGFSVLALFFIVCGVIPFCLVMFDKGPKP